MQSGNTNWYSGAESAKDGLGKNEPRTSVALSLPHRHYWVTGPGARVIQQLLVRLYVGFRYCGRDAGKQRTCLVPLNFSWSAIPLTPLTLSLL